MRVSILAGLVMLAAGRALADTPLTNGEYYEVMNTVQKFLSFKYRNMPPAVLQQTMTAIDEKVRHRCVSVYRLPSGTVGCEECGEVFSSPSVYLYHTCSADGFDFLRALY
jgi:hypothetical protein